MLPPGHIAAGFLAAKAYESVFHPNLSLAQNKHLLWLGALFGFIPDIDMFFAFYKSKSISITDKVEHRAYFTHYPVFWLLSALVVFAVGHFFKNEYTQSIGAIILLGSWSHFILDSLDSGAGIKWLWPFSSRFFTVSANHFLPRGSGIFKSWKDFLRFYYKVSIITSVIEIVLLIGAVYIELFGKLIGS